VNYDKTGRYFEKIGDSSAVTYESTLYDSHGGMHPVEVYARKVVFDVSESIQWILRDITERKELDSLREDLTSMIYHDLRSPLANIVSSLDVIADMMPEGNERETVLSILKIAENSTDRIQRLVSSLLDVNKLESGQAVVDQKVVDALDLIRNAVEDVRPVSNSRRQTLKTNLPEQLPVVWVDEDMARRVLINLMENSSKFTPTGGALEVGAQPEDGWLHIWIKDNGPGIPPAEQERIFDKFTRLRGKGKPGGLGIGLAFCRLAVHGHGGRIWVESDSGQGATFHFTFPVATAEQIASASD
jgi:signal transduction histidine kinase